MKTVFKFLLLLVSLSFFSCNDPIQIKLDEGSKLYVIDAFINSMDTAQLIRVTTSDSYFSNKPAPVVANAAVVLKDLTDNKSYTFQYTGNGNYTFPRQDSMAKVNHQYELRVTINGYTYSALTTQKRAAGIDSIYRVDIKALGGGFGNYNPDDYYFSVLAKDKVDSNVDYYWLKVFRNDSSVFSPTEINTNVDGTGGAIDDAGGLDSLSFTAPGSYLYFTKFHKGDVCRVEIHSLSRDTYYFLQQVSTQVNNGGLFATTPENVKTNFVTPAGAPIKAVGWFSMATVASKSKKAE